MPETGTSHVGLDDRPNYDVDVLAADLIADLVEKSAEHAKRQEEYRRYSREDPFWNEPLYWALEQLGAQRAYGRAIAVIQPENHMIPSYSFVDDGGFVKVREYMAWLSRQAKREHEDSYGPYTETRQADFAESAYAKVLSLIRNDYGVGWPRLDEVGGNPLPEDLP